MGRRGRTAPDDPVDTRPRLARRLAPAVTPEAVALVEQHVDLARFLARQAMRRLPGHVRFDDLHSAALLGLTQAAISFDPARGVPFKNHAWRRIEGAIKDEIERSMRYDASNLPLLGFERSVGEPRRDAGTDGGLAMRRLLATLAARLPRRCRHQPTTMTDPISCALCGRPLV